MDSKQYQIKRAAEKGLGKWVGKGLAECERAVAGFPLLMPLSCFKEGVLSAA
jgi:hypothetical protein